MKIISWNVNGLRSILSKGLSDFLKLENPDVLCLQEIKCNLGPFMEEEFKNLGYAICYNPALKPGYSGTLTAWRSELEFQEENVREVIPVSPIFYDEGRLTLIRKGDTYILNLYVPSGTSSEERHDLKLSFLDEFRASLISMDLGQKKLIVCGDFNVCHQDIDIHHPIEARKRNLSGFRDDEREKFSQIVGPHLVDFYRLSNPEKKEYSWWSYRAGSRKKNLGWRIDYFLVSENLKQSISKTKILTAIPGSDHCPLLLSLL